MELSPKAAVGEFRERIRWMVLFVMGGIVVLLGRLFYIQLIDNARWVRIAEENVLRRVDLPSTRGIIRDSRGRIIATNRPSYTVYVIPGFFKTEMFPRFAEYLVIPAFNAFKLPDSITDEVASILDPFGNATHTALSFNLVGEDVLITGAGPIGIMATAIARFVGARHVVVTDVNDYRLGLATKMGASRAINVSRESLDDTMQALGMVEGFDVGLEMSGNPSAFRDLLRTMHHGGNVALLGIPPDDTAIDWNEVIFKGLMIKGVYGREMFETWYKMAAMLQSGLDVTPIITHRLPVDDYREGFEIMRSGQSGKVILDWAA